MHGTGKCPFTRYLLSCNKGYLGRRGKWETCELWDEYEQECAINLIVRLLRKS